MTPFLERIATAYVRGENGDLADVCFIFPNKRSGTFFRQYLNRQMASLRPSFEPHITTISDFIADFSDFVEAGRYDLLFTLYNEYVKLANDINDFDSFVYWGEMLVADFNDVDRYLVDADMLFRNVTDYNNIVTDFLTTEQKAIIKQYWGIDMSQSNPEEFWLHLNGRGEPRVNRESFVKLWEVLAPLYRNYRQSLSGRGLCYSGMQYKEVAAKLADIDADRIPYRRIVFVGFNVLSMAELKIFKRLRDLGVADFYWDYDLPEAFKANSSASHFIKRYVEAFPSLYDITLPPQPIPDIEIVSVPSNVGQVKLAAQRLEEMVSNGRIANPANAIDTAVVLPSEDLFIELLHSVPESIGAVNITMGYPLRLTAISSLMHTIMSLHLRAKKVRGEWNFYYDDVKDVLAHSLIRSIAPEASANLRKMIESRRLYTISISDISCNYPQLDSVFFAIDDLRSWQQVHDGQCRLVDFIVEGLLRVSRDETSSLGSDISLELGFLKRYRMSIDRLHDAIEQYGVAMRDKSYLHLIERTIGGESVSFVGEPLNGLQIMGVLETRALDFDNVMILSMNERIFPRKHFQRSFVPDVLRRAFGMSTIEFQECIYAYYFYRLIARAKHVTLCYDSRTSGLKGGEMSRYLYQLLYLCDRSTIVRSKAYYDIQSTPPGKPLSIEKTPDIMARLNRYTSTGDDAAWLSASAIKKYIHCPLSFYFHYIERVKVEEETADYIDESTLGTIVHEVLERLYMDVKGNASRVDITAETLDAMIANTVRLQQLMTSATNHHFIHLPSETPEGTHYDNMTPLQGEARVIADVICELVVKLLELEKEGTPFYFVGGEHRFEERLPLDESRTYNLRGSIDRIDELPNGTLRIIDYKTGADAVEFKKVEDALEKNQAVMQLYLYSIAYAKETNYDGPIMPMLYRLRKLSTEGLVPLMYDKDEVVDYRVMADEIAGAVRKKLLELFNPDVPFMPAGKRDEDHSACKYCSYKELCNAGNVRGGADE